MQNTPCSVFPCLNIGYSPVPQIKIPKNEENYFHKRKMAFKKKKKK